MVLDALSNIMPSYILVYLVFSYLYWCLSENKGKLNLNNVFDVFCIIKLFLVLFTVTFGSVFNYLWIMQIIFKFEQINEAFLAVFVYFLIAIGTILIIYLTKYEIKQIHRVTSIANLKSNLFKLHTLLIPFYLAISLYIEFFSGLGKYFSFISSILAVLVAYLILYLLISTKLLDNSSDTNIWKLIRNKKILFLVFFILGIVFSVLTIPIYSEDETKSIDYFVFNHGDYPYNQTYKKSEVIFNIHSYGLIYTYSPFIVIDYNKHGFLQEGLAGKYYSVQLIDQNTIPTVIYENGRAIELENNQVNVENFNDKGVTRINFQNSNDQIKKFKKLKISGLSNTDYTHTKFTFDYNRQYANCTNSYCSLRFFLENKLDLPLTFKEDTIYNLQGQLKNGSSKCEFKKITVNKDIGMCEKDICYHTLTKEEDLGFYMKENYVLRNFDITIDPKTKYNVSLEIQC